MGRNREDSMLVLGKGELSAFVMDGKARRISCVSGRLWVTVPGKPDDVLLAAGEELTVKGRGKVVIEALRASMARVRALRAVSEKPRNPEALGIASRAFFLRPSL